MMLIRAGRRVFNVLHMVSFEADPPPTARVRVTMVPGVTYDLEGADAAEFMQQMGKAMTEPTGPPGEDISDALELRELGPKRAKVKRSRRKPNDAG
jgi:hypothetical protein